MSSRLLTRDIFHTFPLNRWKKLLLFSGDQRDAAQQLVVQSVFQQAADLIGSGGGIEERLGNQSALQAGRFALPQRDTRLPGGQQRNGSFDAVGLDFAAHQSGVDRRRHLWLHQ